MLNYFNKRRKKGQSTLEYVILIIIILGALLSIQFYIKRGIQGRLKSAADDIGDQFSPGNTNVVHIVNTHSKTKDLFGVDENGNANQGVSVSKLMDNEVTTDLMNSYIIQDNLEFWGHDQ